MERDNRNAQDRFKVITGGGDSGGPSDSDTGKRLSAIEADNRLIQGSLDRIEPKVDRLDERVRALEVSFSKVDGKLDMIVAKMPSWWQQPVSAVVILGAMAAAIGLAKAIGVLH